MRFDTTEHFDWQHYTIEWILRSFAALLGCTLIVGTAAAIVPGPAWVILIFGSLLTLYVVGAMLFWTIAEMIEDGLTA